MLQKAVLTSTLIAFSILGASTVFAGETGCSPQYGGQDCPEVIVTLDKKVALPTDSVESKGGTSVEKSTSDLNYVDNISSSDTDNRYSPTQRIVFRLVVKNTSDQTIEDVVVTDKVPFDTVENISTSGSFDSNTKTVTINIDEMEPGQELTFYITGTIVGTDKLPKDQDVVCSVNQSFVTVSNDRVDEDNATFCIEKGKKTKGGLPVHEVPEVKTSPPTGPELFALIPLVGSALGGFILRRKSR